MNNQHSPNSIKRRCDAFLALLLSCAMILTSCGSERILRPSGQTGESYEAQTSREAAPEETAEQERFSALCDGLFREQLTESTLDLHFLLTDPEKYGIDRKEPLLGSCSLEKMISDTQDTKELAADLSGYDRALLTDHQKLVHDVLTDNTGATLMSEGMELYYQPLAPTIGVQAQLPVLFSEYSFRSARDVEDYLALLSQTDTYYAEIMEFEKQKSEAGLFLSDASADQVIQSCESYLIDPQSNFLTDTFAERLDTLDALTEKQKTDYKARHTDIIGAHFVPAYQLLIDGMTALKGTGINDGGLANYKDGKKHYEYLLRTNTGTSYTIPQLKKAIKRKIDSDVETIGGLFSDDPSLAGQTPGYTYTEPEEILNDLKEKASKNFPELADVSYEVKTVPEYLEQSLSPAFYLMAPIDQTDRNVIYINNGSESTRTELYTTLAHEGFPGHLYQTVYFRSHCDDPLFASLSCPGFCEGWATYVEEDAYLYDNGLSEGLGEYFARLRSLSLGIYCLLDIGINYEGWNLDRAEELLLEYFDMDEETMMSIYQTLIDNPCNHMEYYNGYLELLDMRAQAIKKLGKRFRLKDFHRFILDLGPVPFTILRPRFEQWLKEQRR